MKGGQTFLIGIFALLFVIVVLAFYFYYFGVPKVAGEVVSEKKVSLITRDSLTDNLIFPRSLQVYAIIGEDSAQNFEVTNYDQSIVGVSCNFEPFQEGVPSSKCFTRDPEGNFIGEGDVRILPGRTQIFTASVRPFNSVKIRKENKEVHVNIKPGIYNGEIELRAYSEENKESVSVVAIPVEIVIER